MAETELFASVAVVPETSTRRVVGAGIFAFFVSLFAYKACDYTIPIILSSIKGVEVEAARETYESWFILNLLVAAAASVLCGFVAGFLARKHFVAVALASNSILIGAMAWMLYSTISQGTVSLVSGVSVQLYTFVLLMVFIAGAAGGGVLAQRTYDPAYDLDLGNSKATVFGIRWPHFFWILPIVGYQGLATAVMILYAGVLSFLADFYLAFHPSLWFDFAWLAYCFIGPCLVYGAGHLLLKGVANFALLMQFQQHQVSGGKRFWKVIWYGILFPMFAFALARIAAAIAHNLPKPSAGDWKIGIALMALPLLIGLGVSAWGWIRDRLSAR
jgi:hypothetical protein